jgi:hypothetical protein
MGPLRVLTQRGTSLVTFGAAVAFVLAICLGLL